MRFETRAIHAGQDPDPAFGALSVPIYQTSTFAQEEVGKHKGYEYARTGNPTRTALEAALGALEGGRALCFSSGLGATSTFFYLLKPGDHVVLANDVYGGTYRLLSKVLTEWGVEFDPVDLTDLDALAKALRDTTKVVWVETPTNPTMRIIDIRAVAEAAHAAGAWCVVDNTFASPYLQRPLELGADAVIHSTTKYLGGHSDVVGGRGGDRRPRDRRPAGVPAELGRRRPGAVRLLPGAARAEDPRPADGRPLPERRENRRRAAGPADGQAGLLSGAGGPSGPRDRGAADVGLRRDGLVRDPHRGTGARRVPANEALLPGRVARRRRVADRAPPAG